MRGLAGPLAVLLASCGGGGGGGGGEGGGEKPKEASIAKALRHVVEGQEKTKAALDTEAMDKMKEKAAEEAAVAHEEVFQGLMVVPEGGPGKLAHNCKTAASAYDVFMTARLTGDAGARWAAVKEPDLNKVRDKCISDKNENAAACKAHALQNAPSTFTQADGDKILVTCEDKFRK